MSLPNQKYTFFAYWFLLGYIVIAIIWWLIILEEQNTQTFEIEVRHTNSNTVAYQLALSQKKSHTLRNISEGSVSLLVIFIGAFFLYRLMKRTFYISHKEQNFIMAVSHELKTPLTTIQLNLETLQTKKLPAESTEKLISTAIKETKRLNNLYNNILMSSQFSDAKSFMHSFEKIALTPLLQSVITSFQLNFPTYTFLFEIEENLHIYGHKNLMHLLFYNLLDNAVKYSKNGGQTITIRTQKEQKSAVILIKDEGIGITDRDKKYVFQKFYRGQNEQTRETKGTGLGLYIVQQTIKLHKGHISIIPNTPQGAVFIIRFKTLSLC